MTAHVFGEAPDGADPLSPDQVAPLVAYLASPAAAGTADAARARLPARVGGDLRRAARRVARAG